MGTELIPSVKTLLSGVTVTAASTSTAFSVPIADCWSFYLNVTAASGTGPTLDVSFQTSVDGGTTYINVPWRFAQISTTATNVMTVRNGFAIGQVGVETATSAGTGGTLQSPCVVDPSFLKLNYVLGATTPSFTLSLYVISLPWQWMRQQ